MKGKTIRFRIFITLNFKFFGAPKKARTKKFLDRFEWFELQNSRILLRPRLRNLWLNRKIKVTDAEKIHFSQHSAQITIFQLHIGPFTFHLLLCMQHSKKYWAYSVFFRFCWTKPRTARVLLSIETLNKSNNQNNDDHYCVWESDAVCLCVSGKIFK